MSPASSPTPTPPRCRSRPPCPGPGVTGRWLYSIEDVFVHLLEQDAVKAAAVRADHESHRPAFAKIMNDLSPYLSPSRPDTWQGPRASVATPFHRWQAPDWQPGE